MSLFGTSGIRQLADASLLDIALKAGLVIGQRYHRILIGSDTRTSSPAIKTAFLSGILAAGASPVDAGIIPTPTLAFSARDYDCAVMITASHNPPEYNGLKMLNPDGSPFSSEQQKYVEDGMQDTNLPTASWDKFQNNIEYSHTVVEQHISHIRSRFKSRYDIRVVVDCGGGAATSITPRLLKDMGCNVQVLNGTPTGFFPRPSEPVEDNLQALKQAVYNFNADLGLAHDGDADRVMAIDDRGRFVSGDVLLSIFAKELGARKIITTVDASMSIDELGISVIRSAVGDNKVSEALRSGGEFGGEPSGAWIFPQSSLCPDGIYAAALLVDIVSRNKLSCLVDTIKKYPIHRGNITGKIPIEAIERKLTEKLSPLSIQRTDGLKFNLCDGWVLVRPSGTEPKIRFTVESKTDTMAKSIYEQVQIILSESLR